MNKRNGGMGDAIRYLNGGPANALKFHNVTSTIFFTFRFRGIGIYALLNRVEFPFLLFYYKKIHLRHL